MINGHADYAHWDKTYPAQFESVIMPASARQLLLAGVTSARDLGGAARGRASTSATASTRGKIPGRDAVRVRPVHPARAVSRAPSRFAGACSGGDDARAKVRKLADAGVDVIKLIDQDQMTMDEVRAVVDEAHQRGLPVIAHAHRPEEIRRGLEAGVDCFEHTGLATAPEYPPDVIEAIRERTAKMSLGPLFWTPDDRGLLNYEYLRDNPEALDDPSWHEGLPPDIVDDIRKSLAAPRPAAATSSSRPRGGRRSRASSSS